MSIPPASRGTSIARLLSSVARPNPASQGQILTASRASSKIERLKTGRAIPSPRNAYYDPRNRHHDDRGIVITIISECPSRSFRNRHYSAPESTAVQNVSALALIRPRRSALTRPAWIVPIESSTAPLGMASLCSINHLLSYGSGSYRSRIAARYDRGGHHMCLRARVWPT